MGYWGHGVRMAYRQTVSVAGKGDFIWHLDDDNVVLSGAIAAMRVELVDASVLYLFRCETRKNNNGDIYKFTSIPVCLLYSIPYDILYRAIEKAR